MREICQNSLPIKPWMAEETRRLPGLQPVAPGDWLRVDEVYADQMAYRDALLNERRDDVYRMTQDARLAATELLDRVLTEIAGIDGFQIGETHVTRPDGKLVALDRDAPLLTAARLVQEDLVLMQKSGDEHILTAAVLCFPASWTLAEKFGGTLMGIHKPVAPYTSDMGARVQRLFDFIKADRPMWRANWLVYDNPDLFQPRRESDRRVANPNGPLWVRVERQCLIKLPLTGAVVFSIHSYVVPISTLSPAERSTLADAAVIFPGSIPLG